MLRRDIRRSGMVGVMNTISLSAWLELTKALTIPSVPADLVGTLNKTHLLELMWDKKQYPGFDSVFRKVRELDKSQMIRFDCCSLMELKLYMSNGIESNECPKESRELIIDDPRFFDILMEWPEENIGLYSRPWVRAMMFERYPVEYRAYIRDNKVVGISNYYPQISLALPAHMVVPQINKVLEYSTALSEMVCAGSADFLIAEDGSVLFLEGGPPFTPTDGSHPCCFEGRDVVGVALEKRGKL